MSIITVLYLEHFRNRIAAHIQDIHTYTYTRTHEQAYTSQGSQCKFQRIIVIPEDWYIAKPKEKEFSSIANMFKILGFIPKEASIEYAFCSAAPQK